MNTAQWIRDRRTAAGFSQAELARRVGVSQPMISLWERGVAEPAPNVLKQLRTVLGRERKKQTKPQWGGSHLDRGLRHDREIAAAPRGAWDDTGSLPGVAAPSSL
ncbi:MAG TPA: helix-turn-helix transcriptional regulator [Thermoanaerobaculia bacterium]|nr:helix-turn-helix transcriptional regulator [Thermoanaerobaculia bacterium]